ncbi:glycosyltransferase family 4 protein [Flavobacterium sp. ARAG 55.4]|uniref:glycosyltransferase family 4 protein n=1 Tax=Flavobacterium sp. ARAG 55.4 TaxID=3451357 RepID=UPI003F4465F0
MKILFDHQIFTLQQYGGISRYIYELIKRFDNVNNSCNVGTVYSNNAYLNKETFHGVSPFFPTTNFRGKEYLYNSINQSKSLSKVRKSDFDIFHPTYYNDYFLKNLENRPFVITFHDMIHEKFENQYPELSNEVSVYQSKRKLAEKAQKIIAVSETTKKDIIDIYGIDEEKIDVVYLGNSLESSGGDQERIIKQDYILFVGNRLLYKNFEGFVTGVTQLLINNDLTLICAGGGDFSILEIQFIKKMNLEKRIILLKKINDTILSNLYTNALFFVFPSLYEGFGIPVLESFASGCPTLLSTGGSLPEIGGDAAIYFDPQDLHSLYMASSNLISDKKLRQNLKIKGTERIKKFSWDKTFENTLEVYKKII